eukprot:scaffold24.g2948.t1
MAKAAAELQQPPFKRQRIAENAEATADADCSDINDALPCDTGLALQAARCIPFATKSQLYTVLRDRTLADRQLDKLRRRNRVRLVQLPGPAAAPDYAIVLTEDYAAALAAAKAEATACGGAVAAAAVVFDWFLARVLPACTQVMLTHCELLRLLAAPARKEHGSGSGGQPRNCGAGQSAARSSSGSGQPAATAAAGAAAPGEAHVSLLLSHGFLTRHTAGADGYLFSLPGAGAAVRSVAAGRAELLAALARRRPPEALERDLLKRRLARSVLGVAWHLRDMVGGGALLRQPTTLGSDVIRVARRAR